MKKKVSETKNSARRVSKRVRWNAFNKCQSFWNRKHNDRSKDENNGIFIKKKKNHIKTFFSIFVQFFYVFFTLAQFMLDIHRKAVKYFLFVTRSFTLINLLLFSMNSSKITTGKCLFGANEKEEDGKVIMKKILPH